MLRNRRIRLAALAALIALIGNGCTRAAPRANTEKATGPRTITITLPLHQTKIPDKETIQALERAADATLDIDWVPNDIYTDKMNNAIETNSLRMVTAVNQPDYTSVKNAVRSGTFWEIGPYLNAFPNLSKLDKNILNDISVDGKTYGLYTQRPSSRQGVILRKDWLDNLHLQEPGTIDELYNVLKQFTVADPDGNGVQDTIGLTDRKDLLFGAFKTLSSYFGTPNDWAVVNGKFVPDFATPEYMDTMNFMKKLYDEHLINPDFVVTSKQIQRFLLINGKAGAYVGSITDAPRMLDEMRKLNPKAQLTIVNRVRGPKGYGIWSIPSYNSVLLFSKKAIRSEDELISVLAFFDRSMNADVANLLMYGQAGKGYEVKDGKAVLLPEMNDYRDTEVLPFLSLMVGNLSNPNVLSVDESSVPPLEVKANKLVADNEKMLIRDPAEHLSSPTLDAKGTELSQIMADATYDYILGRIDAAGFRKAIAAWQDRGGEQVITELNEAYRKDG
jgi:putative aldouronate transport system substrate-binding protein